VVGLGIPVIGFGTYLLWSRRLRGFLGWHLVLGGAAVLGAFAAWIACVDARAGREVVETFLVYNQLGRFVPELGAYGGGHVRPFWHYAAGIPLWWLPWSPLLGLAALSLRRSWPRLDAVRRDGLRLWLSTTVPVVVVLSLAATKRGLYLDPILPPVALALGAWMTLPVERAAWEVRVERGWCLALGVLATLCVLAPLFAKPDPPWGLPSAVPLVAAAVAIRRRPPRTRLERHLATLLLVSLAAVHLLVTVKPLVDRSKSFVPFVEALEAAAPAPAALYAFRPDETLLGVVGFYTGRRLEVVDADRLARLAEAQAPSIVLVRDRRPDGANYAGIEASGLPHRVLAECRIGGRRTLRILALGGDTRSGERPDPGSV
jgi:4-amino-4-deoxy-L-arabinose transferase-like glycosyltransferase